MSRKMVLVPESMLLELKGKLPKPPEFSAAIWLEQQLDQIEMRTDLTPEEKAALYGQQLYRYRYYLAQAREQQKPTPSFERAISASESENVPVGDAAAAEAEPSSSELEEQVIKSVSNKMQKKRMLQVLAHLKVLFCFNSKEKQKD